MLKNIIIALLLLIFPSNLFSQIRFDHYELSFENGILSYYNDNNQELKLGKVWIDSLYAGDNGKQKVMSPFLDSIRVNISQGNGNFKESFFFQEDTLEAIGWQADLENKYIIVSLKEKKSNRLLHSAATPSIKNRFETIGNYWQDKTGYSYEITSHLHLCGESCDFKTNQIYCFTDEAVFRELKPDSANDNRYRDINTTEGIDLDSWASYFDGIAIDKAFWNLKDFTQWQEAKTIESKLRVFKISNFSRITKKRNFNAIKNVVRKIISYSDDEFELIIYPDDELFLRTEDQLDFYTNETFQTVIDFAFDTTLTKVLLEEIAHRNKINKQVGNLARKRLIIDKIEGLASHDSLKLIDFGEEDFQSVLKIGEKDTMIYYLKGFEGLLEYDPIQLDGLFSKGSFLAERQLTNIVSIEDSIFIYDTGDSLYLAQSKIGKSPKVKDDEIKDELLGDIAERYRNQLNLGLDTLYEMESSRLMYLGYQFHEESSTKVIVKREQDGIEKYDLMNLPGQNHLISFLESEFDQGKYSFDRIAEKELVINLD